MAKTAKIPTFLSYSDNDKTIAKKFAKILEQYNFRVFLAHDDIEIGSSWDDQLQNEIYTCELFLVLLSKNFKTSNFTNHEVGIAIAHNKRIFPIKIDDVEPYGFISKFQAKRINPEINHDQEMIDLINSLMTFTKEGQKIIDVLIKELGTSKHFREANEVARKLTAHPTFTSNQLDRIAQTYLENYEVSESWTAGPYVSDLILKRWNLISSEFKDKLRSKLWKVEGKT